MANILAALRDISQQLAVLPGVLLQAATARPPPGRPELAMQTGAAAPAPAPARTAVLPQATTSHAALPRVAASRPPAQWSTASAATPSAGPAPVPCQPDDASSVTEETPAPWRNTEARARHRQPVTRLPQNRPWTLPECKVTLRPKNSKRFWEVVKLQALEAGDWDLIEKVGVPEDEKGPERVVTVPQGGVQVDQGEVTVDQGDSEPLEGVIQAFPVQKALPHLRQPDKHEIIAWKVVQDLQSKVTQYGLSFPEVMQVIRVLNTELLSPFDIKHLSQVIFQPGQYTVFESNWRRMADKAAAGNMQMPPTDPRHGVPVDALMGAYFFSNPDVQAIWHPQVLE
ncbi:uncharacterized protein ACIQIH_000492 [Cyanocitta cristata]